LNIKIKKLRRLLIKPYKVEISSMSLTRPTYSRRRMAALRAAIRLVIFNSQNSYSPSIAKLALL
jgi:hypothetical protein